MITAETISSYIKGKIYGKKDVPVSCAFDLFPGKPLSVSFLDYNLSTEELSKTKSDVIIVRDDFDLKDIDKTCIQVSNPRLSFFKILNKFFTNNKKIKFGISESAIIGNNVSIHKESFIGPNVIIKDNSSIGKGTVLLGNNYIGENCSIGENNRIFSNVTFYNNVTIKDNVTIHSGTIIGSDGFSLIQLDDGLHETPHIGSVIINSNVLIGANCTIDKATIVKTEIGEGTKIDNQVHIAHNVIIGKRCVIVGQSAIGGSSVIGDDVSVGGQVGIIDHMKVGNRVKIAAKSAVMKSIPDNLFVSGVPATEHSKNKKSDAIFRELPSILTRIRALEKSN